MNRDSTLYNGVAGIEISSVETYFDSYSVMFNQQQYIQLLVNILKPFLKILKVMNENNFKNKKVSYQNGLKFIILIRYNHALVTTSADSVMDATESYEVCRLI